MRTLRRLNKFSLDTSQIFDVYGKEVRSLLEYAVPVWHSGLTRQQTNQIEKIQKTAFRILLGDNYISYDVACTLLGVEPLDLRRRQLCLNFSKKDLKKDNTIFKKCPVMPQTRRVPKLVQEFLCRTHRYENSSQPYLSNRWSSMHKQDYQSSCSLCDLLDYGGKAQLIVLIQCMAHKFAVLCSLPLVLCP